MFLIPGQVIHGRYQIVALLRQGGMGAVYEAIDITLDIRCALKEMMPYPGTPGTALPQLREQFRQEARLLAGLNHPNLPHVTDHFEEDGNAYLVMGLIDGKRLDEIIAQQGALAEDEMLGWARQLMEALAHCHAHDVIHRDVKPQNVIITPQGRAMLVDFGLAKLVDPNDPRTRTVMRGLGTPEYAPPEQYNAKQGYTDARTDVYSLGATLYHALAGEAPPTVTERIVNPKVLIPLRQRRSDVSAVTERVLMKAMALQPSRRFQSIAEMHKALFRSPLPETRVESVTPSETDTSTQAKPAATTVMLPWIGDTKLQVDYRLGVAFVVISLISLVMALSLVAGRISLGTTRAATRTPTAIVSTSPAPASTTTPTPVPTVTSSLTATPAATASPTPGPPTRRPTRTPDEFDLLHQLSIPASPTPTQTSTPLPTHTPTPTPTATSAPRPGPTRTPRPSATPTSTPTPTSTSTPTSAPTSTNTPTATATQRPTPTLENTP